MPTVIVNGVEHEFDGDPQLPLLWYLRDFLGLTGSKFGCGMGICGACTVHQDGVAIRSCITPVGSLEGERITTIEALSATADHPIQKAWRELDVPQCGYCQSGQMMQAASMLNQTPSPTDEDIDRVMQGNICRCGAYQRIRMAIKQAAEEMA
jgi:isoquinoline 1-oxidoreductase alpha subunit